VEVPEAEEAAGVVPEAVEVHGVEAPESKPLKHLLEAAIIVLIMIEEGDITPAIQTVQVSERRVAGILGRYLH